MIHRRSRKVVSFLKTTGLGGVLFLLPLIVLGALIGQVAPIVWSIATALHQFIPFKTPAGIASLVLAAIAILMLLCFVAGLIAKRSFGRRISETFEKNLMMLFPRYAVFKDQLQGSLGGEHGQPELDPVVVCWEGTLRVGFERDRIGEDWVTVYLPGTPDPWLGQVVWFPACDVQPLNLPFGETVGLFEKLGRGSGRVLFEALGENVPSSGPDRAPRRRPQGVQEDDQR